MLERLAAAEHEVDKQEIGADVIELLIRHVLYAVSAYGTETDRTNVVVRKNHS